MMSRWIRSLAPAILAISESRCAKSALHGEKRGDLYFTKEMLLAVGDRYESEIAANKAADAKYR
jgi:hypothetical protein